MQQLFLPVGLLGAFAFALLWPSLGSAASDVGLIPLCVVIIFFVNGLHTHLSQIPKNGQVFVALIISAVLCLVISPLLGAWIGATLALSGGLAIGLLVKAAVPSTLSTCIVMTQLAGGKPMWALLLTVLLNIAGVFSIPLMLSITLDQQQLQFDPLEMLSTLCYLVLLPLLAGMLVRHYSRPASGHLATLLAYLPSSCVIAAVWMSLSGSASEFNSLPLNALGNILATTLVLHLALLLLGGIAANLCHIEPGAQVAVILTASQKTLPVAVSVLAVLPSDTPELGQALLFCVLFHFIQLFVDALLVPWMKRYYRL